MTPLLTHWSYVSFALNHQYEEICRLALCCILVWVITVRFIVQGRIKYCNSLTFKFAMLWTNLLCHLLTLTWWLMDRCVVRAICETSIMVNDWLWFGLIMVNIFFAVSLFLKSVQSTSLWNYIYEWYWQQRYSEYDFKNNAMHKISFYSVDFNMLV